MITKPLEKQLTVFTKLVELEESIGRLYKAYAEYFPGYRQFWSDLADEEAQHAEWLRKLHTHVLQGSTTFSENRFNEIAIQSFINYLKDEHSKLINQERSLINALSISLHIEESLIEREYFKIIDDDTKTFKRTLINLTNATQSHRNQVREALNEYKASILQNSNKAIL